jgi:hypothetical protein
VTLFVAVVFLFFYQQELQGLQMALDAPLQVLECRKHTAATAIHHVTTKTLCLVCNFAVQQLISETRRVYDAKLGNFLLQAQKRAIKLEVKIGVGPASNEIIALGATWVILDRFWFLPLPPKFVELLQLCFLCLLPDWFLLLLPNC